MYSYNHCVWNVQNSMVVKPNSICEKPAIDPKLSVAKNKQGYTRKTGYIMKFKV